MLQWIADAIGNFVKVMEIIPYMFSNIVQSAIVFIDAIKIFIGIMGGNSPNIPLLNFYFPPFFLEFWFPVISLVICLGVMNLVKKVFSI